ncbi:hypothetical protein BUALT_Bualt06G0077800 [Buddleja alternifolia]|uniref:HMG box domain-containing protein n=1 Tax=Buddleja alternifolia TaxID=168488 RepID=A0AAV6XPD8_9LAMI|nr:hypothetical protein BUALT_Bualt06G0077800 [Buddleja alternifolia]
MANSSNNIINNVIELPPIPSPLTPSPSVPLHLSGFLAGDIVQVQGGTGDLRFSLQLNLHKTEHHSVKPFSFESARHSVQSSPSSLSYLTPISSHESDGHHDGVANVTSGESRSRGEVVTRLRSGVLSPVKYYGGGSWGVERGRLSYARKSNAKKVRSNADKVFDKMLRRRSFPLRPCNSYAFFLMANWGVVKCSSFGEKSKRLSKKWYKLPYDLKKEFEHMALKDNVRYKRQCMLLRNDAEKEITSGSQAIPE